MTVGSALQTGLRLLVDRPADVLPVYLLGIGLTATVRVPLVVAIGAAGALVVSDGRLETLVTELDSFLETTELNPEAMAGPPALPPGVEAAAADVFSPGVIALVGLGVVGALGVGVIAGGLSMAVSLHGVYGALNGDDGVRAAIDGLAADWSSFVGLSILQTLGTVLGLVPIGIGLSLFGLSAAAGGVATAVGVVLGGGLVLVTTLLLAFAGQSIVVDDVGLLGGVRRSGRLPITRPRAFVGYLLVAIAVFAVLSILGSVFSLLGISQLSGIVGPLLLLPFLDIVKFGLYADRSEAVETVTTATDSRPHRSRLVAAGRNGVAAVGGFLRQAPLSVLFATAVFGAAAIVSFRVTTGFDATFPTPAEPGMVFGAVPIDTFVMLAANNWLVSATAAYGGLALGVPTGADMLLNGALLGALYGVTESTAFLALVAPHGLIELPAIVVAGGLGFHIAAVGLDVITGRTSVAGLVDALRLAYRVLLGLAVILILAAFIEAFLTPAIAAAIL